MNNIGQRDSAVINATKFILIVVVVYIHIIPNVPEHVSCSISCHNVYHLLSEAISHNIGRIAVPVFFLLSGFFFFGGISEAQNKMSFFILQWKKRAVSLLIPYLFWNLLYFGVIILKNRVCLQMGVPYDDFFYQIKTLGLYWAFWEMPINFPLWYVRDLMCMTVLAPLFYNVIKYAGCWGIVIPAIWYFSTIEIGVPGLSSTAFLFFGVGAYLGYMNMDLFYIPNRFGKVSFWVGLALLISAIFMNDTAYHEYLIRLFCPLGIISLLYFVRKIPDKIINHFSDLSVTVFFIFATHQIYILNWTKGIFYKIFGTSIISQLVTYIFAPMVVLTVCISAFYVIRRFLPRWLAFSIGNRKL